MSNQDIPITVFASPRKQKSYDRQDESRVVDLIRRNVLAKTKVDYFSVSVKINRGPEGSPKSLIAYLLRKDTYTADVKKIEVDKEYKVKKIHEEYDESSDIEYLEEEEDSRASGAANMYSTVDFVVATPVPEITTANAAVEFIYQLAVNAGLRAIKLVGPAATVNNYKNYLLNMGLQGFVSIGHGNNSCIVLKDGTLPANWFQSLTLLKPLKGTVIYFNSCQVFNPPLKDAIMNAGTRTFVGGITNLAIGESEEVCKCFWNSSLAPQQIPMGNNLTPCTALHPTAGQHGIAGDLGPFFAGNVIIFQHIDFRGHHRHIFAMERNLNHSEDNTLNDQISSFYILSGTWKFYRDSDYMVPYGGEFTPGRYRWVQSVGIANDQISSLKCIRS